MRTPASPRRPPAARCRAAAAALVLQLLVGVGGVAVAAGAVAAETAREAVPALADPALERRVLAVAAELRCLVCQNQTIADSNADLAVDLRRQVREMLRAGRSERDILDFMTARYGDFVLYRPPVKATTALLWFGPALLLVTALGALALLLRHRARLPDARFERDEDAADGTDVAEAGAPPGAGLRGAAVDAGPDARGDTARGVR